jgi:hypothetical protein
MAKEPEKRGRGRPSIPEDERRTSQFLIRVTAAELETIKGADDQPARWARETLLKAAKRAQK